MTAAPRLDLTIRALDLADRADTARAEAWLAARADATPFHRPAWLKAVAAGTGQAGHCLIAETGGHIAGLLPMTLVHSALFGRALVSSGFAVDGGIIADDAAVAAALAEAMWDRAERWSAPTAELRGGMLPDDAAAGAGGWQVQRGTYLGFIRDLPADDDAILTAIPRKQRAEVRRGLDNGLTVRVGRDACDRADHYAVYAASVHNLGTPVFPRALFDAVLDGFGGDADIVTVSDGDTPLASVLSLYHRATVMPYWGGGLWAARAARANEVMYHALMRHAAARGCTAFDFGRSKVGTGPAAYKKNWGFAGAPLAYAVRTRPGMAARDINPMSAKYRAQVALWQRLPLPVANWLGPMIARGLG